MTGQYAKDTTVPVERSRAEIESTLARYGATSARGRVPRSAPGAVLGWGRRRGRTRAAAGPPLGVRRQLAAGRQPEPAPQPLYVLAIGAGVAPPLDVLPAHQRAAAP